MMNGGIAREGRAPGGGSVPRAPWQGPTSKKQEAAMRALVKHHEREQAVEANRLPVIQRAIAAGVPTRAIAEALGVTPARVSQMVTRPKPDAPVDHVPAVSTDAPAADVAPIRTMASVKTPLVSTWKSTRALSHYGRRSTAWVTLAGDRPHGVTESGAMFPIRIPAGAPLRALLASLPTDVERVYLTGGRDDVLHGPWSGEAVRQAFTNAHGNGWRVGDGGLYLADPDLPVGRWTHEDGRTVEVHRAATWLGEGDYTPEQAREAMGVLSTLLAERFRSGQWMSTPATTGRDLWRRTIPEARHYPVLSTELRDLIHATSGQGRIELRPATTDTLPGFTYLDGRLMYAALTWGMPVGEPRLWTGRDFNGISDADFDKTLRGRGRWRVTVHVPRDWSHVGLAPVHAGRAGWEYPAEPGRSFETWLDGAELSLLRQQKWMFTIHEGFTFAEGKPLNLWRDKLVEAWTAAEHLDEPVRSLVRGALRSILLFAIGAFAARSHTVTRYGTAADVDAAGGRLVGGVRQVGDELLMWQEEAAPSDWTENMSHPEWSATVWARARVRLLDHSLPGGLRGGALTLPADDVLAFRTDALYVSRDPQWPDDGQVGRFRVKGRLPGPVQAPTDRGSLFRLRDQAEGNA